MTYRGHIKNGVAILDATPVLPDGTPVRVEVDSDESQFWRGKSVDELAREQGVQPISVASDLAIDWPQDDSIDDFLVLVREARR